MRSRFVIFLLSLSAAFGQLRMGGGTAIPNSGYDVRQFGVDCSGATDSSTAMQAAIDGVPNGATLYLPIMAPACKPKIGTTLLESDRVGLSIVSDSRNPNGEGNTPGFV